MKNTMRKLFGNLLNTWRNTPVLRLLVVLSVPVLLLGFASGGVRVVFLLIGYLQLVFRVVLPGEPVETNALQRVSAFAGGLVRMLFFTGMMTHAGWPYALMAAAQMLGLFTLRLGEYKGEELSLLPQLSGAGFLLAGLTFGGNLPLVWIALSLVLALTLLHILADRKQNLYQLRMRFHMA